MPVIVHVTAERTRDGWAAFDLDGRILLVRKSKKLALQDGEKFFLEHGTPERSAETARRARINFAARLWGEEEI